MRIEPSQTNDFYSCQPVNPITQFSLLTIENNHNYLVIRSVYGSCSMYYIITNMTLGNLLFIYCSMLWFLYINRYMNSDFSIMQ